MKYSHIQACNTYPWYEGMIVARCWQGVYILVDMSKSPNFPIGKWEQ